MFRQTGIFGRALAIVAWPFVVVGANLYLWVFYPMALLFAKRLPADVPAGAVAEVISPFSVMVLTHWRAPYTGGFRCRLPRGLRLRVAETAPRGARSSTFVPEDRLAFESELLAAETAAHESFAGVSIPLSGRKIRCHLRFDLESDD